jgi:dinuclear metal center YbgI/SA1388 family protein
VISQPAKTVPTAADVVAVLERHYPPSTAQAWDAVGLVCGEPAAPVTRILFTVDVTAAVVAQAREVGAQLVVAHHPLLLKGIHAVDVRTPKGRLVTDLITAGIAVYCAHTNADVGPTGTVAALTAALGIVDARPLEPTSPVQLDKIITFVPDDHVQPLVDALAAAGAGTIGDYDRCYFATPGTGSFRPLTGATPYVGATGVIERVPEQRVEMILPRSAGAAVIEALRTAHPYTEPAFDLLSLADLPSGSGLGRVGRLSERTTLRGFVDTIRRALPHWPSGIRVAGDPDRLITTVAVQAGSGDDLLDTARRVGADVYVTSDLRHHPAGEALAWPDAPALVDISHWAAEWTWLPVVEQLVLAELDVRTDLSRVCTDPWTDLVS